MCGANKGARGVHLWSLIKDVALYKYLINKAKD
jgi:hypothetical protein